MLKCVYQPCGEEAEYIYQGNSVCKYHLEVEVAMRVQLAMLLKSVKLAHEEEEKENGGVKRVQEAT